MTKILSFMPSAALRKLITRLKADCRGGVLMLMGFSIIPLTFLVGFGIDYGRAMMLQTHMNAAADAAVLAAVAPAMILQPNNVSTDAAVKMFKSQAALMDGYQDLVVTPVVTDGTAASSSALGFLRKATVSYTVKSINVFGGFLGASTLTITGKSTASAAQPPNVDFYLAMDNSPSMLLPATSDGVAKIISATSTADQKPAGCAFACHAQLPHSDSIWIRDTAGRDVLLSTGYYTSGSSKQNVFYRYDKTPAMLYDSAGNAMNTTTSTVNGPNTVSTPGTPSVTSSKKNGVTTTVTTTITTNVTTTLTTTTVVTYLLSDPTETAEAAEVITQKTVTTPSTKTSTTLTTKVDTKVGSAATTSTSTTTSPTIKTTPGTAVTSQVVFDNGYWADGYWLTHNYGALYGSPSGIVLRKDEVVSAASQLIPFAANQASQYHVTYKAQMFSFDWTKPGTNTPVKTLNNLMDVASYGSGFSAASLYPADDYWWKNSTPTVGAGNDDQATEMGNMLTKMMGIIPTAGSGAPGATPQKILFLITDGMLDQAGRYFGPMRTANELAQCTAIKAKGIKIAILYTQYLPESLAGDSWSQTNVAPMLPAPSSGPTGNAGSSDQVLTALQSCASPGTNGTPLVQTVTSNDNITTALQQLFATALQSARLVQ